MSVDGEGEAQRELTAKAFREADLEVDELWMHYFSIGGDAGALEIEAYLHGSYMLRPIQRDLLDHAMYELGNSHGD
ncbi:MULTISPECIES: hypothetical protein [unclassified Arthrobacter]|jgi:hypothetical protein|uniref:hypothetical protein n=1 Tax=unclassified Arthrobacter TaxID=235627 RepID=UPI001F17E455|nr:hypothetical protein [Arthrobacter sp. FW305-BF8]UKA53571.1 hypothetical protein LFT45_17900 [Arthrobacter sp. FW305-BF8]